MVNLAMAGGPASCTTYDKEVLLKAVLDGQINPGKVFTHLTHWTILTKPTKIWLIEKRLIDYLFSVEFWGNYEILLFANTLDVFNHETFMVLSREMVRRSDFYKEIPNNRRIISTLLLNSYITCIERCELMDAVYFEKQLKACFFIETEIYERLHY